MNTKILLIDDSSTTLKIVKSYLVQEGYEVLTAKDAANAFSVLGNDSPDLVITDIMMPDMDGYTFLNHLRKNKKYESLPVIVMSSKSREAMQDLFTFHDISGYLQKPFEKEELHLIVEKALHERDLQMDSIPPLD